jgi:hypothetical protein
MSNKEHSTDEIQNALMGYQVAVDLWMNQGEQAWSKFNSMLVVNSIIIASLGLIGIGSDKQSSIILFLPIFGIFTCILWFIHVRRDAAYSDYFVMSARELEEKYLSNSVKTLSKGGKFAEGEIVTLEIAQRDKDMQMGFWARVLRARSAANWVIVILILLYTAVLTQQLL